MYGKRDSDEAGGTEYRRGIRSHGTNHPKSLSLIPPTLHALPSETLSAERSIQEVGFCRFAGRITPKRWPLPYVSNDID